ncbi:MAG: glycosyltransferase family 39 protein [Nitrospirae bacterium]|nr:glycosyltransferase family 39 protein [Nitrospirota bacterium]
MRLKNIILISVIVLICSSFYIRRIFTDPGLYLILPETKAQWIMGNTPYTIDTFLISNVYDAYFRIRFTKVTPSVTHKLYVKAAQKAAFFLDGKQVTDIMSPENWKHYFSVDLTSYITTSAAEHELIVYVTNDDSRPLLILYSDSLGVRTGNGWEYSHDGKTWVSALSVDTARANPLSDKVMSSWNAFLSRIHIYLPLFIICFILLWYFADMPFLRWLFYPKRFRWIVITLYAILAVNNILKIPASIGFDVAAHYEYIMYIASNWRAPLASEGFSMYHPPLYYFISAVVYKFLMSFLPKEALIQMIRIIPAASAAVSMELIYRAMKYIFPERHAIQNIGTIFGCFIPVKIYSSYSLGNEQLVSMLSTVVILMCFYLFYVKDKVQTLKPSNRIYYALIGAFAGLAMITKFSAILLVAPAALVIIYFERIRGKRYGEAYLNAAVFFVVTFIISGWFYIRNWLIFNNPFINNMDKPIRNYWQAPGFRTIWDFITFGKSVNHPIYALFNSFWDSIYASLWTDSALMGGILTLPPWNYNFLLAGTIFGIIPSILIIVGCLRVLSTPIVDGRLFSLIMIVTYYAVFLHLFLTVPMYSVAKAVYTSSIIVCYAVMFSCGAELLIRNRLTSIVFYSFLACWFVNVYASYFVL